MIRFSDEDQMYILGDIIDRNPDGIAVLREIMSAGNMHMLLGNHEYMMINAVENPETPVGTWITNLGLWYLNGGAVTEKAFNALELDVQKGIIDYMKNLPLTIEVICNEKRYLLAHGSPESMYREGCPYADKTEFAVWNRFDPRADRFDPNKTLICGHTPTIHFSSKVPMEVFRSHNMLFLDCGCAYSSGEGGRLACLRLEAQEVFYSDGERRKLK